MKLSVLSALAGVAMLPGIAAADWFDTFDTYPAGSINGMTTGGPNALGTWQGWDNVAAAAGNVSTAFALSAPNSQQITTGDDSVHRYTGVTSGSWSYTTNLFVPLSSTVGDSYFILLNTYANGGPYSWSIQLQIDCTTGLIFDDQDNINGNPSVGSAQIPIVRNQWVPLRVDFNLTADTFSSYYNNTLIMTGAWKRGSATAAAALAAVDLYNAGATGSTVYYDNSSLVPAPATLALLAMGGLVAGRRRRA